MVAADDTRRRLRPRRARRASGHPSPPGLLGPCARMNTPLTGLALARHCFRAMGCRRGVGHAGGVRSVGRTNQKTRNKKAARRRLLRQHLVRCEARRRHIAFLHVWQNYATSRSRASFFPDARRIWPDARSKAKSFWTGESCLLGGSCAIRERGQWAPRRSASARSKRRTSAAVVMPGSASSIHCSAAAWRLSSAIGPTVAAARARYAVTRFATV